jgi:hypothetical protein
MTWTRAGSRSGATGRRAASVVSARPSVAAVSARAAAARASSSAARGSSPTGARQPARLVASAGSPGLFTVLAVRCRGRGRLPVPGCGATWPRSAADEARRWRRAARWFLLAGEQVQRGQSLVCGRVRHVMPPVLVGVIRDLCRVAVTGRYAASAWCLCRVRARAVVRGRGGPADCLRDW